MQTHARRWLALPVVMSAFFMYAFDAQVVNVALPSLDRELHAGPVELELIVGGYIFVYAATLVTGGRLGDLVGYRRMFLLGMGGFTVSSALCGLAQDAVQLVVARLLQGLTAGAMVPQMLALITVMFAAQERPRALAWYGVTAGLAGVFGQILGGALLVADVAGLGWRSIFLVNVPVGIVVLAFAVALLPSTAAAHRARLDVPGVVLVSAALGFALVPLVFGRTAGWPGWIWACFAVSAAAMWVTVRWERRVTASGGQPLLDLGLFRSRGFSVGMAVNVAFMLFFMSTSFVLSLLLQSGLGLSPLAAGLCFVPLAVGAMVTSLLGRRLVARFGLVVMSAGGVIAGLGVLTVAVVTGTGAVSAGWIAAAGGLIGVGNGLLLPSLVGVPLRTVRADRAGAASGMLSTFQQFASVAGIATIGTAFFAVLGDRSGPTAYAAATAVASWITVGVVVVMVGLIVVLTRAVAREEQQPAPVASATG